LHDLVDKFRIVYHRRFLIAHTYKSCQRDLREFSLSIQ
jgi:hypothetical protein